MYKKCLTPIFAVILLFSVFGCGIKNALPSKEMPPLEGYSTVILVAYSIDELTGQCRNLPILLSYSIGTRLSIRCQDKNWFFDQSEKVLPVSHKLVELGIRPCDIYRDPQLAVKLAKSVQADLVIVGQIAKPRFTREESGKIEYDMSDVSRTGSSRYYAVYQTVILKADLKVIDTKSTQVVWDGRIMGYKKYKTRYRTGNPPLFQLEKTMLADARRELTEQCIEKLYPR